MTKYVNPNTGDFTYTQIGGNEEERKKSINLLVDNYLNSSEKRKNESPSTKEEFRSYIHMCCVDGNMPQSIFVELMLPSCDSGKQFRQFSPWEKGDIQYDLPPRKK